MKDERFKGKELWHNINLILVFILYGLVFIVPIFFPEQLWIVGIACVFFIAIYVSIQQFYYRKIESRYAGTRVLSGWIDTEGNGLEEYEIQIERVIPFSRLPEEVQKVADNTAKQIINEYNKRKEEEKLRKGISIFELPLKEIEYNE